jgi:hypothetical protein
MIEWLHLRHLKGHNVQAYTQEFKKTTLALEIPLHTTKIRENLVEKLTS